MAEFSFYHARRRAALYERWAELARIRRRVEQQKAELLNRSATSDGEQRHLWSSSSGASDEMLRTPTKGMKVENIRLPAIGRLEWDLKRDTIDRGTQTTSKPAAPIGIDLSTPPQHNHPRVPVVPARSTTIDLSRQFEDAPPRTERRHFTPVPSRIVFSPQQQPVRPSTSANPERSDKTLRLSTFDNHLPPDAQVSTRFPPPQVKWSQNTNYFQQRHPLPPSVSMQRRHTPYIGA